jgi:hypothetical protein
VDAQVPHHLATNALDSRQLLDGAKGILVAIGQDVADARGRILRYLARRGVVRLLPEALAINDELAERDPVLAQPAAAAVSGLPPAGPELRCRPAVQLARTDSTGPTPVGALVVQELGFNLHAASVAGACDQPARERLLRFVLRPPLAKERLTLQVWPSPSLPPPLLPRTRPA